MKIRKMEYDGQVWFMAADICSAIGLANPTITARYITTENHRKLIWDVSQGRKDRESFNVSGVRELLDKSRKPVDEFREWFENWVAGGMVEAETFGEEKCENPAVKTAEKCEPIAERVKPVKVESSATIFNNAEFGSVRVIEEDGKILFCASDVAKALGYEKPNNAVSAHCRATLKRSTPISGKMQDINFIPEGDVYRLITHSKLPSAEKFESWVFDEVLPSIRKDGMYATEDTLQKMINNPEMIVIMAQKLLDEKHRADSECERANIAEAKVAELEISVSTLQAENDALIGEITMWEPRALLNAIVRKYAAVELDGDFQKAWRMLYKDLLYRKGILVNGRTNKGSKLSTMTDEEVNEAIGVAVAMCRKKNVDVEDLMVHTAVIA